MLKKLKKNQFSKCCGDDDGYSCLLSYHHAPDKVMNSKFLGNDLHRDNVRGNENKLHLIFQTVYFLSHQDSKVKWLLIAPRKMH